MVALRHLAEQRTQRGHLHRAFRTRRVLAAEHRRDDDAPVRAGVRERRLERTAEIGGAEEQIDDEQGQQARWEGSTAPRGLPRRFCASCDGRELIVMAKEDR